MTSDEVVNDLLGFEGLKIIQRPDMMNFSLDSVLVADFAPLTSKIRHVVDIGTGFAPIPLFLSARNDAIKVTGFEIQEDVAAIARRNVKLNHLEKRIAIINDDCKHALKHLPPTSVDMVTCNPPFFKYDETSNVSASIYKKIARHEVSITVDDIARQSKALLKDKGRLVMVHRANRLDEVLETLHKHAFYVKRLRMVHPRRNEAATMVLIDASNNGGRSMRILPPLYVHEDKSGAYSGETLAIFRRKR
ncbi:MAG: tRNA1(Val) (adenine(37)-N6)-methyltransferase [Bacillota bacterium]